MCHYNYLGMSLADLPILPLLDTPEMYHHQKSGTAAHQEFPQLALRNYLLLKSLPSSLRLATAEPQCR